MDIGDESLAELFEQYKDEVRESIGSLDTELVAIEQDPGSSEVIFSIFRHLHSLKGASKMFNVDNIGHIAHKLEDLMQMIDQDNSILGRYPAIIDLLFRGTDFFRDIINRLETDIAFINLTPEHAQFIEEINRQVDIISRKESTLVESARVLVEELETLLPLLEEMDTESLRRAMKHLSANVSLFTGDEAGTAVRYHYKDVDLTDFVMSCQTGLEMFKSGDFTEDDIRAFFRNSEGLLQALFEVADEDIMSVLGELNDGLEIYEANALEVDPVVIEFFTEVLGDLKEKFRVETDSGAKMPAGQPPAGPVETARAAKRLETRNVQAKTIRVDEKKIDLFLDSVGKLITQSEILNHLQYSFRQAGINPVLVRDFAAVNRTISNDIVNLQRSIMEVRQVEMDNILKKFPRLVRDISHKMEKDAELVISGERIPIDKSLLDDVEQAMIHLVRNAIDHGLETPAEREAAGKSPRGRISIDVAEGDAAVQVVISDDGRGVDFDAVRRKALERGHISKDEFETMPDSEVETLVFRSGLTTKKEATDISGRGVGLDVVLSNIRKWNGEVVLKSRPGEGLTVRLQIPITNTLLTKEAILLKLDGYMFCLPLENVVEIVTCPRTRLHRHRDNTVFQHRDQVVNVINIKERLNMPEFVEADGGDATFILLRGKQAGHKAIAADEIIGQQKIVVKDFEIDSFKRLPYYQGLTLLGDGRVVLILDAEKIVE